METETVQRQDITIQGYTRQSTPALGTERDYTVDQGSRNIDVVFRNTIRSLTSLAIGTFLSAFTGGLLLPLGVALVDVAYSINDDSKTSILTEHTYGHKDAPGLYHKYVQDWYVKADSGAKKWAIQTKTYDYWS